MLTDDSTTSAITTTVTTGSRIIHTVYSVREYKHIR